MAKAPLDVRSLARQHTATAISQLARVAGYSESDSARVMACIALLDRGWGKAPQSHTGENGEGEIKVLVRHIINGRDVQGPVIEHKQHLPIGRREDDE